VYEAHADIVSAGKISGIYSLEVATTGELEESPVLYSDNPYWELIDGSNTGLCRRNHWSQFSFDGGPVTLVVTLLDSDSVASAVVRAGSWASGGTSAISPSIDTVNKKITFSITTPGQYFVYVPSKAVAIGDDDSGDPLFIFVSDIDADKPVVNGTTIVNYDEALDVGTPRSGATTVCFPAGLHELDPDFNNVDSGTAVSATASTLRLRAGASFADNELAGYKVIITSATLGANQFREIASNVGSTDTVTLTENWDPTPTGTIVYEVTEGAATSFKINYGDTVYIHGGAVVKGKIQGLNAGSGVMKIRGRGVLSGEQYLTLADVAGGNEIAINIASSTTGGNTVDVSGITIMDAPRKNFICNDAAFSLYDVKCIGITGDFATMTTGSTMDFCFTKLNDDHMKFFNSNATTTDHTCYLQKAGPGAHVSWQVTGNKSGNLLDGLHCVGADRPNLSGGSVGTYTQFISNALVICTNLGSDPSAGHLTDYTFRNVTSDVTVYMPIGMWIAWNLTGFTDGLGDLDAFTFEDWDVPGQSTFCYFNGNGTSAGTITNFAFNRVFIGGVKVTSANRATYFKWDGNDDQATFTYT
jgi:hypothetical protein